MNRYAVFGILEVGITVYRQSEYVVSIRMAQFLGGILLGLEGTVRDLLYSCRDSS